MTQMYADIDSICVDLRNLRLKLFLLFIPDTPGGGLAYNFKRIALLPHCLISASLSAFAEWFPLRSNEPYFLHSRGSRLSAVLSTVVLLAKVEVVFAKAEALAKAGCGKKSPLRPCLSAVGTAKADASAGKY